MTIEPWQIFVLRRDVFTEAGQALPMGGESRSVKGGSSASGPSCPSGPDSRGARRRFRGEGGIDLGVRPTGNTQGVTAQKTQFSQSRVTLTKYSRYRSPYRFLDCRCPWFANLCQSCPRFLGSHRWCVASRYRSCRRFLSCCQNCQRYSHYRSFSRSLDIRCWCVASRCRSCRRFPLCCQNCQRYSHYRSFSRFLGFVHLQGIQMRRP